MNPLLFPPTLIKHALEDLAAIADAARTLPEVVALVRDLHTEIVSVRRSMVELREGVAGLQAEMAPIQQLPAVREAVEPLNAGIDDLRHHLAALREEMSPIQELHEVRKGIEPLDEDMRSVRESVDHLEPLLEQVNGRLGAVDERIESLRADLSPLGELADKVPGIGR